MDSLHIMHISISFLALFSFILINGLFSYSIYFSSLCCCCNPIKSFAQFLYPMKYFAHFVHSMISLSQFERNLIICLKLHRMYLCEAMLTMMGNGFEETFPI